VVNQQNSRKLLMMNILMSETCWAHKKWNKIASDIKLVFCSSTNTFYVQSPPPENRAVYGIMGGKVAGPDGPRMTIWHTYTLRICNTYCFSTATMIARTRFKVTLQSTACLVKISNPLHKKAVKVSNWYDIHRTKANSFLRYLIHIKKHVDLLPYLAVRIQ